MKKILVIQTAFIGDAILASALLETLHHHYPESQLDFLVRKGNHSLYENHPYLRKVWSWDKSQKYRSMFRIIGSIRKEGYDWVINLQRFASSGFITACSGARKTTGYSKNPLSAFFSRKFPHAIGEKGELHYLHEVDRNNSLVAEEVKRLIRKPKLYPSPEDERRVNSFLEGKFITISPASVWYTKQWKKEKWIELMRSELDRKIYLLGAPSDVDYLNQIRLESNHPHAEVLAGKLSLLQSAALMKQAEMNYVNDSAPMHLASAVNAPVTAVFCSTIPEFGFGPLSDHSQIWQTSEKLDCRPCGLHGYKACPKGHFRCADISISSEN